MTTDAKLARAYIDAQKVIEVFDRREENAQRRCVALGRELERRRAKRLGPNAVIDGDFSEVAE